MVAMTSHWFFVSWSLCPRGPIFDSIDRKMAGVKDPHVCNPTKMTGSCLDNWVLSVDPSWVSWIQASTSSNNSPVRSGTSPLLILARLSFPTQRLRKVSVPRRQPYKRIENVQTLSLLNMRYRTFTARLWFLVETFHSVFCAIYSRWRGI